MKMTVACNWQSDLIEKLNYPEVTSLFGGLPETIIAGGRYSGMIAPLPWEQVEEYIKKVHGKGWKFIFNLNSTCLSNMELKPEGFKKILDYIGLLSSIGVDGLTISQPTLLEIIKKNFPEMKIKISTFQKINSVSMARHFEELGADALMLSEHINRDLKLIKAISKAVKCKIIVIANVGCIYECSNMFSHANAIAHSGAKSDEKSTILSEIYSINCLRYRLNDPVEFIKTRWIRPEDLDQYEDAGVDMIKIIDRNTSTADLVERVHAYHNRSYNGNLIDLLGQLMNTKKNLMFNVDYTTDNYNPLVIEKLMPISTVIESFSIGDLIHIDNNKIPADFLKQFSKRNCSLLSCNKCQYCHEIAKESITLREPDKHGELMKQLDTIMSGVADGSCLY